MGAAANTTLSAVQAAVNEAVDGETVTVPPGTSTWSSSLSLPNTKGISLIGAGVGNTIITLGNNPIDFNTSSSNSPARISGFTLNEGSSSTTGGAIYVNNKDFGSLDWRIDNCRFNYQNARPYNAVFASGYSFGVIDNCSFYETPRGIFVDMGLISDVYDPVGWGDYSWTQPSSIGTANNLFVEDCYFENTLDGTAQAIECRFGTRYVFRHNTVMDTYAIETHSGCSEGGRNPFSVEIYENTINCEAYSRRAMFIRSVGQHVVYNNTMLNSSVAMHMDYEQACDACEQIWPPIAPVSGYPGQDQPGRGTDTGWLTAQAAAPCYSWGNTLDGSPTDFVWEGQASEGSCSNALSLVQEDRDYYLGTQMPGYTAYTYPHPLRGEADIIDTRGNVTLRMS